MAVMSIAVDGELVAAVDNDDLAMLSVHLRGSVTEEHVAALSCDGTLTAGHSDGYRVWLPELPLREGQVVTIRMDDDSRPALTPARNPTMPHPGLSPESVATLGNTQSPSARDIATARSHARVRPGFSFALATSRGTRCDVKSGAGDEQFQCLVMWTLDWEPEYARIRALTTNRERILRRDPGTPVFDGRLFPGDLLTIRCGG